MHDDLKQLAILAATIPTDHRVALERLVAVEARKLFLDVGRIPGFDPLVLGLRFLVDGHVGSVAVGTTLVIQEDPPVPTKAGQAAPPFSETGVAPRAARCH